MHPGICVGNGSMQHDDRDLEYLSNYRSPRPVMEISKYLMPDTSMVSGVTV